MIESQLDRLLAACGSSSRKTRWYLFGSALTNPDSPRDIDLLIVYPDGELDLATHLIDVIEETPEAWNIDLVILSQTEESEIQFVAHENCVPIEKVLKKSSQVRLFGS